MNLWAWIPIGLAAWSVLALAAGLCIARWLAWCNRRAYRAPSPERPAPGEVTAAGGTSPDPRRQSPAPGPPRVLHITTAALREAYGCSCYTLTGHGDKLIYKHICRRHMGETIDRYERELSP